MTDRDTAAELERLTERHRWSRPVARDLALWLVALTAPAAYRLRPVWAVRVVVAALTGRRRLPRE